MAGKMTIYKLVVLGDGGVGKVRFSVPLFSFPPPLFSLASFLPQVLAFAFPLKSLTVANVVS
jgi:hypothetical protein